MNRSCLLKSLRILRSHDVWCLTDGDCVGQCRLSPDATRWCEIIHTFKSSWVGPLQIWGDLDLHPGVEFERDKYNICLRYVNLISMCLVIYGHRSSSFVMEWVWGQFYSMPQNTTWIGKLQIPSLRSSMRNKCHFINICFPLWLLGLH